MRFLLKFVAFNSPCSKFSVLCEIIDFLCYQQIEIKYSSPDKNQCPEICYLLVKGPPLPLPTPCLRTNLVLVSSDGMIINGKQYVLGSLTISFVFYYCFNEGFTNFWYGFYIYPLLDDEYV